MEFLRCEFIRDLKLSAEGTVLGEEDSGEGGLDAVWAGEGIVTARPAEVPPFVQSSTCRAVK